MAWAETERQSLGATLRASGPEAPTLCAGWQTRHLLAHLVQREQDPVASVGDLVVRRPPGQERYQGGWPTRPAPEGFEALVTRFLAGAPAWSPMSWATETVNLVEYVVHHEDVRRGAGEYEPRFLPFEQVQTLWTKLGVFARLAYRKSPVGVTLTVPGGSSKVAKVAGTGVTLAGDPVELALYVTGRRQAAAVEVSGPAPTVAAFEAFVAGR